MKPADLRPGDRIAACTTLTVSAEPWQDRDPYGLEAGWVYVDVTTNGRVNLNHLAATTGAHTVWHLGGPHPRLRLRYRDDTDITVEA